jgi:hypothetical protein
MNKSIIDKRPHLIAAGIAAIMLLLAIAPWPYGYYQLLRFVVCGTAAYVAFLAYNWQKLWVVWIFGFVAVLFNPLLTIHLSREIWQPIDIICGMFFIVIMIVISKPKSSSDEN